MCSTRSSRTAATPKRPMLDVRHHLSPGCFMGAQLVGDHDALLLQQPRQQALGRFEGQPPNLAMLAKAGPLRHLVPFPLRNQHTVPGAQLGRRHSN